MKKKEKKNNSYTNMVDSYGNICSICLEDVQTIKSLIITECLHVFCPLCSAKWFYKSNRCPNCNHNNVNIYKLNKRKKIKKKINLKSHSSFEYIFKKIIREESFKPLNTTNSILTAIIYISDFFMVL